MHRPSGGLEDSEVAHTVEALEAGQLLSEAAGSGSRLSPTDQAAAENALSTPVVAQVCGLTPMSSFLPLSHPWPAACTAGNLSRSVMNSCRRCGGEISDQQSYESLKILMFQGVLTAMRGQLTSVDYWRSNDRGAAASTFLQLLAIIIPKQPLLHPQVPEKLAPLQIVDVISGSLRTMGNARPEVARSFIEMAVLLLQVSSPKRTVQYFSVYGNIKRV